MVSNPNEDRWMNTAEAAAYLGYAVQTLYNKVAAGELEPTRLGRTLRFRRSALDRWVETRGGGAESAA